MNRPQSGREPVQIHVFQVAGFDALKASLDRKINHDCWLQPVGQWRALWLFAVRPFEDSNPVPRHPTRFLERGHKVVCFVQHVAKKHQVKGSVCKGQILRRGFMELGCWHKLSCHDQQIGVDVDARHNEAGGDKGFGKHASTSAHVQHAGDGKTIEAQLNDA